MTGPAMPSVTVAILTFNGERYLDAILGALEAQRYDGKVDILVVDSGSTDRTLEIVAKHPGVRLHEIPNDEFGHGRTRNLVAQLAVGEIVAYLTHDAVPADNGWLAALIAPMVDDDRIVAVIGKQVARPSAPPVLKYDIARVFTRLGPDYGTTIFFDNGSLRDETARNRASFYSDACSAARRDILLHHVPYRDVQYAEDRLFGRDLIDRGYRKAYAPMALVEHSNDGTLREFGQRIAADVIGLRQVGAELVPVSRLAAVKQWVKWSLMDAAQILVDRDYGRGRKLYWLVVNPVFHMVKWKNYRAGSLARIQEGSNAHGIS